MNLVELLDFLKKFAKKFPNFGEKGLVQLEMGERISTMIVVAVSDKGIRYRFKDNPYAHTWDPRSATLFRWKVAGVDPLVPKTGAPKVLGGAYPISIKLDRVSGHYSRDLNNG